MVGTPCRVAGVNRRAAGQKHVCKGGSAVVLQRAEQGITAARKAAGVVLDDIVPRINDGSAAEATIAANRTPGNEAIADRHGAAHHPQAAAGAREGGRVTVHCATADEERSKIINPPTFAIVEIGRVPGHRAVRQGKCATIVDTAAISTSNTTTCVIVVDCAVDDRGESGVVDTPTTKASTVIGNCAVIDDEHTAQVIDAPSNRPIVKVNKGIIQSQ